MHYTTAALFLKSIRYGEHSLILRFYTEQHGLRAYIAKGKALRGGGSERSYFSPLSLYVLEAAPARRGDLDYLRSAQTQLSFLDAHPAKIAVVFLLAELLNQTLREATSDPVLFDYLSTRIRYLESAVHYADFPLCFVLELTRYLGFYPNLSDPQAPYFSLQQGVYTREKPQTHFLTAEALALFERLSRSDTIAPELRFNRRQRGQLLDIMECYYRLHIANFKPFRSRAVLEQLFD